MECIFLPCKQPATEIITCETCFIPKYCSQNCKLQDAESHSFSCRPHLYSLKDFIPVTDSPNNLGSGTYGEVQLVQKKGSKQYFAQKTYKKSVVASVMPLKILFREISVHQTLIHPNIVRLFDHMEDRGKIYLILEYAEKGSLFNMIRKKIKLTEKEAWPIFAQTCVGLHYLHSKNLLHRDLKPENLLISQNGTIKIGDFGWSARGSEQRVTFCGTLDYMSPEMLKNLPQTNKVDIWALGVLLYEMLHGAPPFRAKNPREMAKLISERGFTLGNHVSGNAKSLISEILQEDPDQRPGILEILKHPWVQRMQESRVKVGWSVRNEVLGEGVIENVCGLVVAIRFDGRNEEIIENDLVREFLVTDFEGNIVFNGGNKEFEDGVGENDQDVGKNPLFRNLGIGSKSQKTIKPAIRSNNGSRNPSPGVRFDLAVKSPKALEINTKPNPTPNRTPDQIKTLSPTQSIRSPREGLPPRRQMKHDFEGINISPISKPAPRQSSTPKSSFLQKFKNSPHS